MNESRLRPKVVLWWGIGLAVVGLSLSVLVPQLFYSAALPAGGPTPLDQGLLTILDLVTRIFAQGIAPLGIGLIAASVVMTYVARLFGVRSTPTEHLAQDR